MLKDELIEIGLTRNEAAVFLALTETGPSTTGPVIKKSGLYRVILYDTLDKLAQKGLVSHSFKNKRKIFAAEPPQRIVEMLKGKEALARAVAEKLQAMASPALAETGARVYEGWQGIRAAQEKYFTEMRPGSGGEYLMVGASRALHKKLDAFFNDFHERRSKLKIPAKLLFNENNRIFGKLKKAYKPVQVRFMPAGTVTPSWMSTYKDMTLIGVAEETPMAILVNSRSVAESYRQYFYFMWERGKA
ncbi:MAG: helix-turn-helix domain-containing protein [Nanoarchaeota archaeon]